MFHHSTHLSVTNWDVFFPESVNSTCRVLIQLQITFFSFYFVWFDSLRFFWFVCFFFRCAKSHRRLSVAQKLDLSLWVARSWVALKEFRSRSKSGPQYCARILGRAKFLVSSGAKSFQLFGRAHLGHHGIPQHWCDIQFTLIWSSMVFYHDNGPCVCQSLPFQTAFIMTFI